MVENKYNNTILPDDLDGSGQVTIPAIYRKIIDAVGTTIRKEGYGLDVLASNGLTWVLARCAVEVFQRPGLYRKIVLEVSKGCDDTLCHKRYVNLTSNGQIIGHAVTDWCIMDKESRKPRKMKIDSPLQESKESWPLPKRIKPFIDNSFKDDKAEYSECDFNGHLNNCRYIDRFYNLIPDKLRMATSPIRIDINFKHEIPFGANISSGIREIAENIYDFCMYTGGNLACCASISAQ